MYSEHTSGLMYLKYNLRKKMNGGNAKLLNPDFKMMKSGF